MNRPIGIDLFAGAGGMSLGFEQAGFDVVAAVEIDPIHAAVHKYNFPECAVIPKSVIGLKGSDIRKIAEIEGRNVDVVFGGAPCQGFSLIGKRALEDPRNLLVREFVRIVLELDASYFVFENVKGLTVGKHRQVLEELVEEFTKIGYSVVLPWQVLNASLYRVPQNRERLFLLGAKKGKFIDGYPSPITRTPGTANNLFLPEGPTCYDALGDLPDVEMFDELLTRDNVYAKGCYGKPSTYSRDLRCMDKAAWHNGYPRIWNRNLLTCSLRTEHSDISRRRFAKTLPGDVEPISRFFRLSAQGVSNTLRAGTDSARGAFTSPRPIHYEKPRCITVREMARLQGFPDWFRFHATKWHGARQVGNSVPPPLARAIASAIIQAMGLKISPPDRSIELGDTSLVQMDMSNAADYWEIQVPIGKRDRKSVV